MADMFSRFRRDFRRWRRARPFWGGLLTILSGVEYAFSAHLDLSPVKIEVGPQSFLTWVVPLILILCGALLWGTPAHRVFYGVIAVAVAVYGLIGVNLGGFLVGMVLGMVGGALGASWGRLTTAALASGGPWARVAEGGAADRPPAATDDTAVLRVVAEDPPAGGPDPRGIALAILVVAALTGGVLFVSRPAPAVAAPCVTTSATPTTPSPTPTAGKSPSSGTGTGPSPAASASATPSPAPSASSGSSGSGGLSGLLGSLGKLFGIVPKAAASSPTPSRSPSPSPSATTRKPKATVTAPRSPRVDLKKLKTNRQKALAMTTGCASALDVAAPAGLKVAAQPSTQTTALLSQSGLSYVGVATLPTGDGGSVRTLEFTMDKSSSTPFDLKVPVGSHTLEYKSSGLTISGNVALYATSISGWLFGVLPVTFTPDSPPLLTVPDLFFTSATVKLAFVYADTLTAPGLTVSYSS